MELNNLTDTGDNDLSEMKTAFTGWFRFWGFSIGFGKWGRHGEKDEKHSQGALPIAYIVKE